MSRPSLIRAAPRPKNWDLVVALRPWVSDWVYELAKEYAVDWYERTVIRIEWENEIGVKVPVQKSGNGLIRKLNRYGFVVHGTRYWHGRFTLNGRSIGRGDGYAWKIKISFPRRCTRHSDCVDYAKGQTLDEEYIFGSEFPVLEKARVIRKEPQIAIECAKQRRQELIAVGELYEKIQGSW